MRRRDLVVLATAAGLMPLAASAQQRDTPVVGWLSSLRSDQPVPQRDLLAFRQGLAEVGFVEGQNIVLEYRWAEGHADRLPGLAAELVARNVDVIATQGGDIPAAAAKTTTSKIPIVFNSGDPVAAGLIASLARPGANLTGVAMMAPELMPKLLELLLELVPRAGNVALLQNPQSTNAKEVVGRMQQAARAKAVRLTVLHASNFSDFDTVFAAIGRQHADGLIVDLAFGRHIVAPLASREGLPAIALWRDFPMGGGLASYGPSLADAYRLNGVYVGRILNRTKPADLPVQQPTKFELVINMKTAKALGLSVPAWLLARADEVIE